MLKRYGILFAMLPALAVGGFTGCQTEAGEESRETLEGAADQTEEGLEEAGDAVEDAGEETKDAIE